MVEQSKTRKPKFFEQTYEKFFRALVRPVLWLCCIERIHWIIFLCELIEIIFIIFCVFISRTLSVIDCIVMMRLGPQKNVVPVLFNAQKYEPYTLTTAQCPTLKDAFLLAGNQGRGGTRKFEREIQQNDYKTTQVGKMVAQWSSWQKDSIQTS